MLAATPSRATTSAPTPQAPTNLGHLVVFPLAHRTIQSAARLPAPGMLFRRRASVAFSSTAAQPETQFRVTTLASPPTAARRLEMDTASYSSAAAATLSVAQARRR